MRDYLIVGHLDGCQIVTRKITAQSLAHAKTALKNALLEPIIDEIEGSAEDVELPEFYVDFAAPAENIPTLDPSLVGSLGFDEEDDDPVACPMPWLDSAQPA
ncbi:hypothetical protein [Marinobacter sp.]|uniref:hypothetical protein n=1 Tax=Marinobacter sp. TaxID=50741 RepID=UPI003567500A